MTYYILFNNGDTICSSIRCSAHTLIVNWSLKKHVHLLHNLPYYVNCWDMYIVYYLNDLWECAVSLDN